MEALKAIKIIRNKRKGCVFISSKYRVTKGFKFHARPQTGAYSCYEYYRFIFAIIYFCSNKIVLEWHRLANNASLPREHMMTLKMKMRQMMMDPFLITKIQKLRAALKPPRYLRLAKTSRGSLDEKGIDVLVIFVTTLLLVKIALSTI